ncbi:macrolide transporter ATP-binding /permease protein [Pseudoalteromonas sp. P1-9]|uniref:ABC transporter permease n=1 Tax=Pseudoalteromonas sp. P1-9 TaxID=1710354 RepID=UPI0006D5E6B9|nr:ABC transporter permease [Pseudoalteromonas sp. P1-9]KPV94825.1 macrolide transporter ATP-binding /permease protein [Pseudoalteromonas sp. P1-9]
MSLLTLSRKSLLNRFSSIAITTIAIALSITLLLLIERARVDAKASFHNTVSGTDLIVGARTGSTELLLFSVFRIGHPTNNLSFTSYQDITSKRSVKWAIPLSLGDSHKGFSVIGTNNDYFAHYRYANKQNLAFSKGHAFEQVNHVVLGSNVAKKLHYHLGDSIILSHGAGNTSFHHHDDHPFKVVGILAATGTAVDNSVHVPLVAIDNIHGSATAPSISEKHQAGEHHDHDHHDDQHRSEKSDKHSKLPALSNAELTGQPKQISAFLLGLKSPIFALQLQRNISQYKQEPLLAIMPKFTLRQLWEVVGIFEKALLVISGAVVVIALLGMLTNLLASLSQRRRELAILRSVGATPRTIFTLLGLEALLITVCATLLAIAFYYLVIVLLANMFGSISGIHLQLMALSQYQMSLLAGIILLGTLFGCLPAYKAYRYALSDGLTIKV